MLGIQQFFTDISSAIATFSRLVVSFFRDTIEFLKLLGKIPRILASAFEWMPPAVWGSLAILFSVVILYKVLGREG